MPHKPREDLKPNTADFENLPFVKAAGFREYDARWLFEKEINLRGIETVGLGLGTLIHDARIRPHVICGHDFRRYSASIKYALMTGLMRAGCTVHDIGLALSPMAYFSQFALEVPAVAMVTASHNENGWTGIKMGMNPPLTFGPEEMSSLKAIIMDGRCKPRAGGSLVHETKIGERYLDDLLQGPKLSRRLKVVVACGNGTAGIFAPQALKAFGCDVVPVDCDLDYNFPHYNPNPEDMQMLHAIADAVRQSGADIGFGFDGDGDRCGFIDHQGREIFADKIGLLLARDLANNHQGAKFVVDIKSTGLYEMDAVLAAQGAKVDYWKTGHSHMKRRTTEIGALAGFEKSGHFFFRPPVGRGYDDGLLSAIAVCRMLDRNPQSSLADLYDNLPKTWGTPTMSPTCSDDCKYAVVESLCRTITRMQQQGELIADRTIHKLNSINGIRFSLADGSWGLVRASSNKPELVVVCESPTSELVMRKIFQFIEHLLSDYPEVGVFNQKI